MKHQTYNFQQKKFRLLSLPVDQGACGNMRVRRPFKYFGRMKGVEASVLEGKEFTEKDYKQIFSITDVVIAKAGSQKMMGAVKELFPMKPIVVDMDDDLFNVLPSSEHYRTYGPIDIAVPLANGKVRGLWQDGQDGFNKWANRRRLLEIQYMIEEADAVIAVTDRLANYLSERMQGRDVYVVPNAIDFSLYPDVEVHDKNKGGEFRFGFCGGMSHFGDINMVRESIIKFLKGDKNRIFYMIGQKFKGFKEVKDQVRHMEWMPFEANPFRMKVLDLDLLIAPLQDFPFNNRKDPLKFWDAAALRVPLLASKVAPFIDVMKDGDNGLLFETPEEFLKTLKKVEKKRQWAKAMADNAYDWVYENRNLEKLAPRMIELYKHIAEEKRVRGKLI